jgi:hypothetical protein
MFGRHLNWTAHRSSLANEWTIIERTLRPYIYNAVPDEGGAILNVITELHVGSIYKVLISVWEL